MMPMSFRRLSVAALATAAVFSVGACSVTVTVSKDQVEKKVSDIAGAGGSKIQSVKCPGDLKGEVGAAMKCTIDFGEGQTGVADVKVVSVDGTTVNFDVTPGTA